MTTEAPIFSPEVEELLHEIAREPDSILLRVPREKVPAMLMETRSPIGPMTAGLTSAERELVRVHREEFAFQLRQACWVKLATSEEGNAYLNRRLGLRGEIPTPALEHVQHALEIEYRKGQALGVSPPQEETPSWNPLTPEAWPNITAACAVAHRMVPAYQNWMYASLDWAFRNSLRTAMETLTSGLSNGTAVLGQVHAYIAFCEDHRGNLRSSLDSWKLAVELCPDRGDFLPSQLVMALRIGSDNDIASADRACQAVLQGQHLIVTGFVHRMSKPYRQGHWRTEPQLVKAIQRWMTRLSDPGRTIAGSMQ